MVFFHFFFLDFSNTAKKDNQSATNLDVWGAGILPASIASTGLKCHC